MKRTSILLSEKQLAYLAQMAQETSIPVAEHFRRAVDMYILFMVSDEDMAEVVSVAQEVFSDAATPDQALRRALFRWLYDRQTNSNRQALARVEQMLDLIVTMLGAREDATDHA